jgi:hypothetical protein
VVTNDIATIPRQPISAQVHKSLLRMRNLQKSISSESHIMFYWLLGRYFVTLVFYFIHEPAAISNDFSDHQFNAISVKRFQVIAVITLTSLWGKSNPIRIFSFRTPLPTPYIGHKYKKYVLNHSRFTVTVSIHMFFFLVL